jgi:hypothetical protein
MRIVAEATRRRRELESSIQRRDRRRIIGERALHCQDGIFGTDQATPAEVIACARFLFNGGTVFEPWMKKALELVDGYFGYLVAKSSALTLVTSLLKACRPQLRRRSIPAWRDM